MTCTGVTHSFPSINGKKLCEEFQGKILIYDCCFVVNVGGSEENVSPSSAISI